MSKLPPLSQKKTSRSHSFQDNIYAVQKLKEQLYNSITTRQRQKLTKNPVIESIVQEADFFLEQPKLKENLYKLKNLGLLKNCQPKILTQQCQNLKGFVMNDYHNKSTTNGYSRNYGGLFYNR